MGFFALLGAMSGWFAPPILLARSIALRAQAIAGALPGALELLVVCVEAGLSLEDALEQVSKELMDLDTELAEELAITWAEVNILPNRLQAFYNLAERVKIPSVRSIMGMLAQSMQFGTPLAQSLRTCANEMRNDQLTLMEERTSKLPALMTVPVMLFILPTMFLIIGGPAALRILDNFH
jgi:tight adherence protein C